MTTHVPCPKCGEFSDDITPLFADLYEDGDEVTIKCPKCDAVYSITQEHTVSYSTNESCGNHDCPENAFHKHAPMETCLSVGHCQRYATPDSIMDKYKEEHP